MPFPAPSLKIDPEFLSACLKEAGCLALGQRGQFSATVKADNTPVTEVDRQVEELLILRIQARYPGHTILSEESGLHGSQAEFTWVIDPIDGTRAFASGLPVWGVSIGVLHEGLPYAGGLYLPVTDELYWGSTDQAWYNDRPLPLLQPVDPNDPLTFLAVPSDFHLDFETSFPRIRSMGSTAAHLAYVASGSAIGMLTSKASLWDIAGLLPALQAVGAEVRCLDGSLFEAAGLAGGGKLSQPIVAAHPALINHLSGMIFPKVP